MCSSVWVLNESGLKTGVKISPRNPSRVICTEIGRKTRTEKGGKFYE